ncbi:MAG TPA: MFS transporter, partial [Gaiellaceae bacterium]|nr:MFS transporter [Gaiellaceae bacterium]
MQALRKRNFALLFAARTVSFFGTNLVPIALAFAVLDITGSATDVGIVFAARTVAQVATLAVGGVIADRLPRRLVMIGSDAASLAVQTTMGILLVTGHARIWELVVLHAALGAAAAFYAPASSGLVPQTVPAALLQQANGYMAIARYSATVLGAAVGGALVATIGSGWGGAARRRHLRDERRPALAAPPVGGDAHRRRPLPARACRRLAGVHR